MDVRDNMSKYITAVYWAFTTMTTVGYGDIRPYTNLETGLYLLCCLVGCLLFAPLIGAFAAFFEWSDTLGSNAVHRKLDSLRQTGAVAVAAGNIGCISQLDEDALPVRHTVQFIDWASGGPSPL